MFPSSRAAPAPEARTEHAKKPENGNGCENGGVLKPSREGANVGGGSHNGKHYGGGSGPSNEKPDSGVAGYEGGNDAGATEGAEEGGILEKLCFMRYLEIKTWKNFKNEKKKKKLGRMKS
ncbi:hypothetical protein L3X38_028967 [Prunus dulcis]|uniref:Uncharacterized protein n=1 Tax=Prunus dulcis TaxID=3755 RepID=A0AAD4VQS7_PRUDU|nr:hypothetical protein L3X38_028967 [Prunus dulcis]